MLWHIFTRLVGLSLVVVTMFFATFYKKLHGLRPRKTYTHTYRSYEKYLFIEKKHYFEQKNIQNEAASLHTLLRWLISRLSLAEVLFRIKQFVAGHILTRVQLYTVSEAVSESTQAFRKHAGFFYRFCLATLVVSSATVVRSQISDSSSFGTLNG